MRCDLGHQVFDPNAGPPAWSASSVGRTRWSGQMRHMLVEVPVDHVAEPWGLAQLAALAQQPGSRPSSISRRRSRARSRAAVTVHSGQRHGHAAPRPGKAVVQREGPTTTAASGWKSPAPPCRKSGNRDPFPALPPGQIYRSIAAVWAMVASCFWPWMVSPFASDTGVRRIYQAETRGSGWRGGAGWRSFSAAAPPLVLLRVSRIRRHAEAVTRGLVGRQQTPRGRILMPNL